MRAQGPGELVPPVERSEQRNCGRRRVRNPGEAGLVQRNEKARDPAMKENGGRVAGFEHLFHINSGCPQDPHSREHGLEQRVERAREVEQLLVPRSFIDLTGLKRGFERFSGREQGRHHQRSLRRKALEESRLRDPELFRYLRGGDPGPSLEEQIACNPQKVGIRK